MLVMVVFFIAFRWIHLATPLIRLFLLCLTLLLMPTLNFFFQAEDGIRDGTVTGVQTCALPISVNTVKTRLFHARAKLRQLLGELSGGTAAARRANAKESDAS